MQILFITSSRVGDAILTTGILKYLTDRYQTAKFTIACGPVAKGLFDNVPGLEEVITMRKDSFLGHWRRLYFSTLSKHWDLVVDLRGSAIAWFLPTKKRLIYKKKNKKYIVLKTCKVSSKVIRPILLIFGWARGTKNLPITF